MRLFPSLFGVACLRRYAEDVSWFLSLQWTFYNCGISVSKKKGKEIVGFKHGAQKEAITEMHPFSFLFYLSRPIALVVKCRARKRNKKKESYIKGDRKRYGEVLETTIKGMALPLVFFEVHARHPQLILLLSFS